MAFFSGIELRPRIVSPLAQVESQKVLKKAKEKQAEKA